MFAYGDAHAVALVRPGKNAALLHGELALLEQLDALGLPTVNARPTRVGGQVALLMTRYAHGSKDVVRLSGGRVRVVGSSRFLNKRSVADLTSIRQTMLEKNIRINDLQFLIGLDGRVVISDPLSPIFRQAPSRNNLRMIDLLIRAAGG